MSMSIQCFETILIFSDKLTEEEYEEKVRYYKKWFADDDVIKFLTLRYDGDYTPDKDEEDAPASIKSEQRKKPVDVFDLIFGL